jgi:lipopolysaccharide assembly protein A
MPGRCRHLAGGVRGNLPPGARKPPPGGCANHAGRICRAAACAAASAADAERSNTRISAADRATWPRPTPCRAEPRIIDAPPLSQWLRPAAPAGGARRGRLHTRISGIRTALIAAAALIVVLIFIIQDAHAVSISFLGAHLRLSLAVPLLVAAVAGALVMAAAGTARITQQAQAATRAR